MSLTQLIIDRDAKGTATYFTETASTGYKYTARAQAGVALSLPIPAGALRAFVNGSDSFYVSTEGPCVLPIVGAGFGVSTCELDKATITIGSATTLYFIARQETDISVSFMG